MPDDTTKSKRVVGITWFVLVLIVAALVLAVVLSPDYIRLLDIDLNGALKILGTLFIVTAFVERAVQVILGIWVEPGKVEIKGKISAAKANRAVSAVPDAEEVAQTLALEKYRGATGKLAFTLALFMGIAVSWIGVRSLRALIDPVSYDELGTDMQRHVFTFVDVLITGALIAGGSNGMHELMQTIVEFFNKLRVGMNPETRKP
jgi:hypothetical protein